MPTKNGAVFSNEGMDGDENGLIVANATNSTGYMTLTDGGSQYNAYEGAVLIGRSGNGTLAIENGAKMIVSGSDEDAFAMHLGVEEGVDRTLTRAHIAWQVDDLAAWMSRLAVWGITPLESVPIPGYDRFEFRDPFGNRVEFIQPLDLPK